MKFKFTKKWCEKAAKSEKGVGGLMACNPKYLKESKVAKQKITKEQKEFINGKIKKVPGLSSIIKQQEEFIEQTKLTQIFLKMYEGNPDSFHLLIGEDVWKHYQFDKGLENPEWMWECIDEMTCDIMYGCKNFQVTANGIFVTLHFSKTKNKKFKELFEHLKKYGQGGEWWI